MNESKKTNEWRDFQEIDENIVFQSDIVEKMMFIEDSKKLAREHEWLFHCTSDENLLSILKKREFWLSNLKLVNDKEEIERVDVPEYENTYYVTCFTYDSELSEEHWIEYGNLENGVLIGIKPAWIKRAAVFMNSGNEKCESEHEIIKKNRDKAFEYKIMRQKEGNGGNPFFINAFDFYQIVYSNEIAKKIKEKACLSIDGSMLGGMSFIPEVAGIIKAEKGICQRWGKKPYEKDWTIEKEVRLKVGIQQLDIFKNGHKNHDGMIMNGMFFPKVAVPVTDDAFEEIKIKFSPDFKNQDDYIKQIKQILPNSVIQII